MTQCQVGWGPLLDIRILERYRGLGDPTHWSDGISLIPAAGPRVVERSKMTERRSGRSVRVWGAAWRVETPHMRGRPFTRGSTNEPIETRGQGRKRRKLLPLVLRRLTSDKPGMHMRNRVQLEARQAKAQFFVPTSINVGRCPLFQQSRICMSRRFKRSHPR